MERKPWLTSLSFRLSLILAFVVSIFWLLSTFTAIIIDLEKTNDEQIKEFNSFTLELAKSQDNILSGLKLDIQYLIKEWQLLPNTFSLETNKHRYLKAHYITSHDAIDTDDPNIDKALAFSETYGSGGLGNFVDTFVVLKNGIAISGDSNSNTPEHIEQINSLKNMNKNDIYWGVPYLDEKGNWNMITAMSVPNSEIIIGFTSQLSPPFGQKKTESMQSEELVWLSSSFKLLTSWPEWVSEKTIIIPDCDKDLYTTPKGVLVICRTIQVTGWHLLLLIPSNQLSDRLFSSLQRNLLVALFLLITLVFLLYLSLQRSLGRKLSRIVRLLAPHPGVNELKHLPITGYDELGQIAASYNRLLDMVKEQYANLEKKVTERTLELDDARLKAELANANKSEQLTNISHEIRTPLNGIIGGLELLKRTKCDVEQYDLIDTVIKCSEHLLDIINNLLDFSRIDSGQMQINSYYLDPLPLIDQSMLTVQLIAVEKKIILSCLIRSSFPKEITTDGLRFRQILINLLGNAVKFTSSGNVSLEAWSENGKIYIRIKDSGPGIPRKLHEEIFTPFMQLSSHIGGSGLGLPISRSLAHLLGGDLYLEESNYGCSFILELPNYCPNDTGIMINSGKRIISPVDLHEQLREWGYLPELGMNDLLLPPDLRYLPHKLFKYLSGVKDSGYDFNNSLFPSPWSLNVLIVDDVKTNRDIISKMLIEQGQRVTIACSGSEALAYGKSNIFDLILMDIRMPELSGIDTILLWKDNSSKILDPDCPVVALTANAQPGERERLLGHGFSEYITKPIHPNTLSFIIDFASDIQLTRGIELTHNISCQIPVLQLDSPLQRQIESDINNNLTALQHFIAVKNWEEIKNHLHILKGVCGQVGFSTVHNQIEYWELLMLDGHPIPDDAHDIISRLLDLEMNRFH